MSKGRSKRPKPSYEHVPPEVRSAWKAKKAELAAAKELANKPQFVFARDGGLEGRKREVNPKTPHQKSQARSASLVDVEDPHHLYVYEPSDLNELTLAEVQEVWDCRFDLCGSIEAAAEAFAILRVATGLDEHYQGWRAFLNHPMVRSLAEEVDSLAPKGASHAGATPTVATGPEGWAEIDDMLVDRREVAARNVRLRKGQTGFRQEVFAFHGGQCCITGCTVGDLLEAAHVAPYRGEHTHDVRNGLLLRVDIHRLFDRHLIAIDPVDLVVRVASSVSDKFYRSLDGRRVFRSSNAPHRSLLRIHYQQFASKL